MGKVIVCDECRKAYRDLEALEDLRDNDGICLVCNNPIEVEDWDRVLASYEDDDFGDMDDEDFDEDDFGDDDFGDDDFGNLDDEDDGDEMDRGIDDDDDDDFDDEDR